MEIKKRNGTIRSRATTYDNISEVMIGLNDYHLAELYAGRALELRDQNTDKDGWMTTAERLVATYMARKEIHKALELALSIEQMANNPNYLKHQLTNALSLVELYTKTNKPLEALEYARKALLLKDSLFSGDMSAAVSSLNVRYRTEEQRQKIEQADKNNRIKTNQIKRQTYFIILLVIALLLLFVVAYLLYMSNRVRTKAREKTELLMFELSHRVKNNLQIITGMLSLQISESDHTETIAAIIAAKNRIQSIGILHAILYRKEYTGKVDMEQFISVIAQNISHAFGMKTDKPDCKIVPSAIELKADEAVLFGIIINELLTNIYKYAKPLNEALAIEIRMNCQQNQCKLLVSDNGMEWHPPADDVKNKGLGLRLIRMLANQAHAAVTFEWAGNRNNCSITFEKS
jgi:two-component sensor histidine kinase